MDKIVLKWQNFAEVWL